MLEMEKSSIPVMLMLMCMFASAVFGEYIYAPNYHPSQNGAPMQMPGPPPVPGSQEWINQQRNYQNWQAISYIYWTIPNGTVYSPTITPLKNNPGTNKAFNANTQASDIYKFLFPATQTSSEHRNEKMTVSRILAASSSDQRQQIDSNFTFIEEQQENSKRYTLKEWIKMKYRANSEKFLVRIIEEPGKLDAFYLNEAITGTKDKKDLNELATTRSNLQYQRLRQVYQNMYGKDLIEAIRAATNIAVKTGRKLMGKFTGSTTAADNPYQKLLVKIFSGERDEYNMYREKAPYSNYHRYVYYAQPRDDKVEEDVTELIKHKSNTGVYVQILGERSYHHIREIVKKLLDKRMNLEKMITENFASEENFKNLLLTIYKAATDMPLFFAERFKEAIDPGFIGSIRTKGLDDDDFIRYLATRSQVDLGAIIKAFDTNPKYNRALLPKACSEGEIKSRPEYREGVIQMLLGNDPVHGYHENYNIQEFPEECRK